MSYIQQIFDVLCQHPYGLSGEQIASIIYADREDGGPLTATVKVMIYRFNCIQERERTGIRIRNYCRNGDRASKKSGQRTPGNYRIWIVRP